MACLEELGLYVDFNYVSLYGVGALTTMLRLLNFFINLVVVGILPSVPKKAHDSVVQKQCKIMWIFSLKKSC